MKQLSFASAGYRGECKQTHHKQCLVVVVDQTACGMARVVGRCSPVGRHAGDIKKQFFGMTVHVPVNGVSALAKVLKSLDCNPAGASPSELSLRLSNPDLACNAGRIHVKGRPGCRVPGAGWFPG